MKRFIGPVTVAVLSIFVGLMVILFASAGSPTSGSQQETAQDAAREARAVARQTRIGNLVELGTDTTLRVAGALVAVLAAVELLRAVYRGGPAIDQLPALVAVLAGLLMVSRHWPLAAAVGVVGVAVAAGVFARRAGRPEAESSSG